MDNYIKGKIILLVLVILSSAFLMFASLLIPYINMLLIDRALLTQDYEMTIILVATFGSALVFIDILSTFKHFLSRYLETLYGFILRLRLHGHIHNLKSTDIAYGTLPIYTNDIDIIKTKLTVKIEIIFAVIQLVSVIIILTYIDVRLLYISLLFIIIIPMFPLVISNYLPKIAFEVQNKKGSMTNFIVESLTLIKEIRLNNAVKKDLSKFTEFMEYTLNPILRLHKFNSFFVLNNLIYTFFMILILYFGSMRVLNGEMTIGELIAITTYLAYLAEPINSALSYYSNIKVIEGSEQRYHSVMNQPQIEKVENTGLKQNSNIALEFKNTSINSNESLLGTVNNYV